MEDLELFEYDKENTSQPQPDRTLREREYLSLTNPFMEGRTTSLATITTTEVDEGVRLIFPGVEGARAMAARTGASGPGEWHVYNTVHGSNHLCVRTGYFDGLTYILDPSSNLALTPGFDGIVSLDDDRVIGRLGTRQYVIEAGPLPSEEDPDYLRAKHFTHIIGGQEGFHYPRFLGKRDLVLYHQPNSGKLSSTDGPSWDESQQPDIFGLQPKPVDASAQLGAELFDSGLSHIFAYVSAHKELQLALANPETTLTLPEVMSNRIGAQLHLQTLEDGRDIIHLQGTHGVDGSISTSGLLLVRNVDSSVSILDGSLATLLDSSAPNYPIYAKAAQAYLKLYFEALKVQVSSEALSGATTYDLRAKLGQMSVGERRRTLKKALQ